jgi:hypothetical protein
MKSLLGVPTVLLLISGCAFAQGKQDKNMRQIHRDLSAKSQHSVAAITKHASSALPAKTSASVSANSELNKLEHNSLSTKKAPKRTTVAAAHLPKDPGEVKTGSGISSLPPRHKDKMTTNKSGGHSNSRGGIKRGSSR